MYAKGKADKNLALFDFDGTLCDRDSFTGFIFYSLKKRHILKQGIKILPWIKAYYLNIYPAHYMRPKLFAAMFSHMAAEEMQQIAEQYAMCLIEQLNPAIYAQLLKHQHYGDDVVLVSASLNLYLSPLCQHLNIDLICTEIEIKQQIITGQFFTADCSAEQKRLRVLEKYRPEHYQNVYAYGNSKEDLAMFKLANYSHMVGQDTILPPVLKYRNIEEHDDKSNIQTLKKPAVASPQVSVLDITVND